MKTIWLFVVKVVFGPEGYMADQDSYGNSSNDRDLRYFPRWEVNNRVVYRLEGEFQAYDGFTKDISCVGACITGDGHVAPHQQIQIALELDDATKVHLKGYILWVRLVDNKPQMGVTFYDTPDDVQALILQRAFELDKDKVVRQWYKGWNQS